MKKRIAVLCAHNDCNLGMYTVDLAARSFFSYLGRDFDLLLTQTGRVRGARFIRVIRPNADLLKGRKKFGDLRFKLIPSPSQLCQYTHVVYWGDFVNSHAYRELFEEVDRRLGHSDSTEEASKRWVDFYTAPKSYFSGTAISVGTNFQIPIRLGDVEAQRVYRNLGQHLDVVFPRDPVSLLRLEAELGPDSKTKVIQGLDCAMLLPPPRRRPRGIFVYYFHRSQLAHAGSIVQKLEKDSGFVGRPLVGWLGAKASTAAKLYDVNRELLRSAEFVVTDTYHVCVNALATGTPVFGIGRNEIEQRGTLGDFKKQSLFSLFGISDLYFTRKCFHSVEEHEEIADQIVENVKCVSDRWHVVQNQIGSRIAGFRESLIQAIDS